MTATAGTGSSPDTALTSTRRGKRRNVIDRGDARLVLVVATISAIVLGMQSVVVDVSPTSASGSDALLVGAFAMALSWAGASAPWWAITAFGGAAAALTVGRGLSWWLLPALVAVGLGMWLGSRKESMPWVRSAAVGLALLGLMRAAVDPFFGASAVFVGLACVVFAVIAVARRPRRVRRRVIWGVVATAGVSILAVVGLGVGGLQAKDDLVAGRDHLTAGLDQLRAGDTVQAAASLHEAAIELRRAGQSIDAPWTQPSRLIPVVAHHRAVLSEIIDRAAESALAAANALDVADIDHLQVVNGTVDVDALALLAQPLTDLDAAVADMTDTLREANSPWLAGTVQHELDDALVEIESAGVQSNAIAAAAMDGPAMLGIDGARHYLVVFTSPGEARGQSGLIGNWAEISITDGKIRQTDFGRTAELIADITAPGDDDRDPSDLILDASTEYLDRYGPLGAGSATTGLRPKFWSNVTMSPDTPTVAAVMAQMYEAGGRRPVDGVFVMDATGLAALLRVAGPVTVEDLVVSADTLEQFLLFDQYQLDEFTRRDLLEAVAGITLQQFLTAELPAPQQLVSTLGPAATEGHIVGWARRPEEQRVFRLIGMDGRLPQPAGRDGLAVVTDNASGNKIDSFLERTSTYTATYDPDSGRVSAELVVTLRNTAPTSGYPDYVIGNLVGLPTGTNRTMLSVYSPLAVEAVTIDDQPASITSGTELGWNTSTLLIEIPAGTTRTVTYSLDGVVDRAGYAFVWRAQPLARPETVAIDVRSTSGGSEASFAGELARLTIIDRSGQRALR